MSKKKRALRAHHEAAHAVIARYLNVPCLGIFMFSAEPGAGASAMTRPAAYLAKDGPIEERLDGIRRDALVSFAGPIANVLFLEKPSAFTIGTADDVANIMSCAAKIVFLESGRPVPEETITTVLDNATIAAVDETVETLKNDAHALVKERWPAIEAVASALMHTDLMDEATLDRLIAGATKGANMSAENDNGVVFDDISSVLNQSGLHEDTRRVVLSSTWTMDQIPPIQTEEQAVQYRNASEAAWAKCPPKSESFVAFSRSPEGLLATALGARVLEWEEQTANPS